MADTGTTGIRDARIPQDVESIERLWLEYLTWGNDELEARHGFRLPVREAVDHDLATVEAFQPPDGRIALAVDGDHAFGIGCLRRIGPDTAEIKRMYVEPAYRRAGGGRALLESLVAAATAAGYARVRLDSPDFMTAAHALYRSHGFIDIGPYPESEIPAKFKSHWVFMERSLMTGDVGVDRDTPHHGAEGAAPRASG
jgi:GNAT superfamily N-acetyltransferase